jgi:hypothetical protein
MAFWGAGYTRKNGEISHAVWQVKGRAIQAYRYDYDHHGQMTNAAYFEAAMWGIWGFTNRYSETVQYDRRGNITNLTRYGVASPTTCGTAVLIDQLTYNYSGQTGNRVARSQEHHIVMMPMAISQQIHTKVSPVSCTIILTNRRVSTNPMAGISPLPMMAQEVWSLSLFSIIVTYSKKNVTISGTLST